MRRLYVLIFALLVKPVLAQTPSPTCFKACLTPKLVAADVSDDQIRGYMKQCHKDCESEMLSTLRAEGLDTGLETCEPQPVPDADMKKVRRASPSPLAYAGAFTWDLHNVLEGRIIRRVELITQNLDLQDVVLSSRGTVPPGQTGTILISLATDGYPSLAVTTRIKALYACPVP